MSLTVFGSSSTIVILLNKKKLEIMNFPVEYLFSLCSGWKFYFSNLLLTIYLQEKLKVSSLRMMVMDMSTSMVDIF